MSQYQEESFIVLMAIILLLYMIPISFIIYKCCQPRQYDYYPDSDSEPEAETQTTTHYGGKLIDPEGVPYGHGDQ